MQVYIGFLGFRWSELGFACPGLVGTGEWSLARALGSLLNPSVWAQKHCLGSATGKEGPYLDVQFTAYSWKLLACYLPGPRGYLFGER